MFLADITAAARRHAERKRRVRQSVQAGLARDRQLTKALVMALTLRRAK